MIALRIVFELGKNTLTKLSANYFPVYGFLSDIYRLYLQDISNSGGEPTSYHSSFLNHTIKTSLVYLYKYFPISGSTLYQVYVISLRLSCLPMSSGLLHYSVLPWRLSRAENCITPGSSVVNDHNVESIALPSISESLKWRPFLLQLLNIVFRNMSVMSLCYFGSLGSLRFSWYNRLIL